MRRRTRRQRKAVLLLMMFAFFVAMWCFIIIERNLRPTLIALAEARARVIATEAINDAVSAKLAQDNAAINLVTIRTDNTGRVTFLQANTAEVNRLASETALYVQNRLKNISSQKVTIPLGQVLNSQIFANFGPKIRVTIIPVGTVQTDFTNQFEEAGINQTRLTIYLLVKCKVQVVVPMVSNFIEVTSHVPVSDSIIVGEVPTDYWNFRLK